MSAITGTAPVGLERLDKIAKDLIERLSITSSDLTPVFECHL